MKFKRTRLTEWMLAALLVSSPAVQAQDPATYDWLGTAPDGNWSQGTPGERWSDGYWDAPPPTGILRFDNNHQLTMVNNAVGYNVNELFFDSGNTSTRTIGGNDLQFFDFGGNDPEIINNSTAGHIINLNITGDNNNTFQIGANSGDLTFGGAFNNNGSAIRVYSTGGHDVNFNGVISGGGGLTIDGNTIVHLGNAHTYSGNTTVNAGTLMIGANGTLNNSSIVLGNTGGDANATLLGNNGTYANNITVRSGNGGTMTIGQSGVGNATFSGSIALSKGVTLTADVDRNATFSGSFSGNQAVTLDGPGGKVVFSGATGNDFSLMTINSGFVDFDKDYGVNAVDSDLVINNGSLSLLEGQQIADTANVTVHNGTFNLGGQYEQISTLNMAANTALTLGRGAIMLTGAGDSIISGAISGSAVQSRPFLSAAQFISYGTGTITINGNNTGMAGDWYADSGTIRYNHNNAVGSGVIYVGSFNEASSDATVEIGVSGVNIANDIYILAESNYRKIINNATTEGSRSVTFSGSITLDDDVYVDSSTAETINLSGVVSGTGDMIKRGFGNTVMTRANTFNGGMYIDEGTLTIGSGGDLTAVTTIDIGSTLHNAGAGGAEFALASGASAIDRNIAVKAGAGSRTISSAANNTISGNITLDKAVTVDSSAGTLTLSGGINLSNSGNNTMTVQGNGNVTMSGAISAANGEAKISKTGSGSLTISGNNSSAYMLDISAGTVNLNHANALGSAYEDKVNFYGTSVLNVNANVGPAGLGLRVADGATATLNVAGGNTFSVATLTSMTSGGAFTKTGAGIMALNGNSSDFDGDLTLAAGTLMGAATIGGDFIQTGGIFAPGNSPDTFVILGNATWTAGVYLWETTTIPDSGVAGTAWDFVDITGSLTIGAGYTVNIDDLNSLAGWNPTPPETYSWLIAEADGGISGFNNLGLNISAWDENATDPGYGFSLRQAGNQIYLDYGLGGGDDPDPPDPDPGSAIPEPNTLSFSMLAGLVLFSMRVYVKRAAKEAAALPA